MANQHTKTPSEWRRSFIDRAIPEPMSGCWLWLGPVTCDGYGKQGGRLAHRISWEIWRGEVPRGLHVLHRCDTACCVNPDHLFLGTHADNMADMRKKGRRLGAGVGSKNGRSKLSDDSVARIRQMAASGLYLREIAPQFDVGMSTISRVLRGESWRHIR